MNEVYVEGTDVFLTTGFGDNKHLGKVEAQMDGYEQFFPDLTRGGYWPSWLLRDIADLVDARNKRWAAFILKDLAKYEDHT